MLRFEFEILKILHIAKTAVHLATGSFEKIHNQLCMCLAVYSFIGICSMSETLRAILNKQLC